MKRFFRNVIVAGLLAGGTLATTNPRDIFARAPAKALVVRPGPGRPDLTRLTVKELRQLATDMKIAGRSKARRKADLIQLIEKANDNNRN